MDANENNPHTDHQSVVTEVLESLSADRFRNWYQERQYRQNIENGTPYFNEQSLIPKAECHRPSQLLLCHRKLVYQQSNAPEEKSDPEGLFWVGTQFEEDIIIPFLDRAITGSDTYLRRSAWIDYRIKTEVGDLQIKGTTDPLIVDAEAVPLVPTEIKTKSSVEYISGPDRSHRAQLHAYMVGLSEKFDIELTQGVIIYGSRESLDVKIFHVEFDEAFWKDVVIEWAVEHTRYRLDNELPPADPEYDWECKFCSYRERCGRGDLEYADSPPTGLLPRFAKYPREKLIEYLEAHEGWKLTPTLARRFPSLADEYGVFDWYCGKCKTAHSWDSVDWTGDVTMPPPCPGCADDESISFLEEPHPAEQSPEEAE